VPVLVVVVDDDLRHARPQDLDATRIAAGSPIGGLIGSSSRRRCSSLAPRRRRVLGARPFRAVELLLKPADVDSERGGEI